jgi:trans-aconitate methyltransferase
MPHPDAPRWNHNIHFHRVVIDAIPTGATSALDVGTGNGMLAKELRDRLPDVTAVDIDAAVLAEAAAEHGRDIAWMRADVMNHDFGRSFDVVASIATLHHFDDFEDALVRLRELTAPGGVLVVVGLADESSLSDRLRGLAGVVQHQYYARTRNVWEHTAPTVWPPPHTYAEVRAGAAKVLPGVRWKQYALWRYSLIWHRPAA